MAARKSLLCSAALMLYLAIVNFQPAEAKCGGFCASCTNIAIVTDDILQANCKTDPSGGVYDTTAEMSLDQFIGNVNGVLVANDAGFFESCQELKAVLVPDGETVLVAGCFDDSKNLQLAMFRLNDHIANVNGALSYEYC